MRTINLLDIEEQEEVFVNKITHPDEEMNRRLIDLGFYKGTVIKRVLTSPKGDPIAYRVRGTTIALRNNDAKYVEVTTN